MTYVTFVKDFNDNYNIKFSGLLVVDIEYRNGKVISIKVRGGNKNYLKQINKFRKDQDIETDDVITIVEMYFADIFSNDFIGKGIFDKN